MTSKGQIAVDAIRAHLVSKYGAATRATWGKLDGATVALIIDSALARKPRDPSAPKKPAALDDGAWFESLKADPFYNGIDIDREKERAKRWAATNNRLFTRRFFKTWLDRAERVIAPGQSTVPSLPEIPGWRQWLTLRKAEGLFTQPIPDKWESLSVESRALVRGAKFAAQSALDFYNSNPVAFQERVKELSQSRNG